MSVGYNQQLHIRQLVVVKDGGLCLLGRVWLQLFKVPWQDVLHNTAHNPPNASRTLEEVVGKYPSLFHDELVKVVKHSSVFQPMPSQSL